MISIEEFTNNYVDRLNTGDTFQARDIQKAFSITAMAEDHVYRLPYSDTIQRRLRKRRSERGDVFYYDYGKSIWWKNDHIATKEERDARERNKRNEESLLGDSMADFEGFEEGL